jgi:hypothetical protein
MARIKEIILVTTVEVRAVISRDDTNGDAMVAALFGDSPKIR